MSGPVLVTKASGATEPFSKTKLEESLARAGATFPTIDKIVKHIENELTQGMNTSSIFKHAQFLLKKYESPVSSRYSLKRAVHDLGPTGYPFERFISEIFRERGFSTKTNLFIKGHCVMHEIDIVAWNEHKLIMIEAKFHNDLDLKSDIKVAMYIKARYDDLKNIELSGYGHDRLVDEFWLITNTKFTNQALDYGACAGIKLIGWNHPLIGNLHDLIDDAGLHPLTCLSTLSNHDKKMLFDKGVVLCKTLMDNEKIMADIGLSPEKISDVMNESKITCEPRTLL